MFVEDGELEEMLKDVKSDEEDEGGPVILLNGRVSSAGKGRGTLRNLPDTGHTPDSLSLQAMTARFASAVIPEEAVVDADQVILTTKISELTDLRKDLASLVKSVGPEDSLRRRKAVDLLKKVDAEVSLYEQFLDSNGQSVPDELALSVQETPSETSFRSALSATLSSPRLFGHRRSISQSSVGSATSSNVPSTAGSHFALPASTIIPPGPNDVLRWTLLPGLSNQVFSEGMKQRIGIPVTFVVAGLGIAIGTSRSLVAIYDFTQNLRIVLGDPMNAAQFGSVTSLAVSTDHTQLVCGYSFGAVCVWDAVKGVPVRTVLPVRAEERNSGKRDGHGHGVPVIHVGFVGGKGGVVSGDNQGHVFYHSVTRVMLMNTAVTTRVHPASARLAYPTTIYALAPLPHLHHRLPYPGDSLHLVALSTPYKLAIMSLKPLQTQYKISWVRESKADVSAVRKAVAMSCLCWWPAMKGRDGQSLSDPLLAASCGPKLIVIRVSSVMPPRNKRDSLSTPPIAGGLEFKVEGQVKTGSNIVSIQWLDEFTLSCLHSTEEIVLYDVGKMREVARTDVKARQVACHDYFSKPLSSLMVPVEMAYWMSLRMYKGRVFIMGLREIIIASRLSWTDRLKALVTAGKFSEALTLGLDFYHGKQRHSVTGLPAHEGERRRLVGGYLAELVNSYVEMSLSGVRGGEGDEEGVGSEGESENEDMTVYKSLAETVFDICLSIDRSNLLFSDIYDHFSDSGLQSVFLETLEPRVLNGTITVIESPVVVRDLVRVYVERGWEGRLEQVILGMDVGRSAVDIHETVRVCRGRGMWSGLCYVLNRAGDFVMPVVEMVGRAAEIVEQRQTGEGEEGKEEDGLYTVFVYLAYVLTGKAFPVGMLGKKETGNVRSDVWSFLGSPFFATWPPVEGGQEGGRRRIGEEPYPYVRTLLAFDSGEFLKTVNAAVGDSALDVGGEEAGVKIRQNVYVEFREGRGRFAERRVIGRAEVVEALVRVVEGEYVVPVRVGSVRVGDSVGGGGTGISRGDALRVYAWICRWWGRWGGDGIGVLREVLVRGVLALVWVGKEGRKDVRESVLENVERMVEVDAEEAAKVVDEFWGGEHERVVGKLEGRQD
ncbi:Vacuolar protein sorting-associated protein 8, partial [Rhizophlyctis rosea]